MRFGGKGVGRGCVRAANSRRAPETRHKECIPRLARLSHGHMDASHHALGIAAWRGDADTVCALLVDGRADPSACDSAALRCVSPQIMGHGKQRAPRRVRTKHTGDQRMRRAALCRERDRLRQVAEDAAVRLHGVRRGYGAFRQSRILDKSGVVLAREEGAVPAIWRALVGRWTPRAAFASTGSRRLWSARRQLAGIPSTLRASDLGRRTRGRALCAEAS